MPFASLVTLPSTLSPLDLTITHRALPSPLLPERLHFFLPCSKRAITATPTLDFCADIVESVPDPLEGEEDDKPKKKRAPKKKKDDFIASEDEDEEEKPKKGKKKAPVVKGEDEDYEEEEE
jgi:hypothetical protein